MFDRYYDIKVNFQLHNTAQFSSRCPILMHIDISKRVLILVTRNLVVALKELSIRGDFRTTVEYLTTLIETESFQNNSCDTGWLDKLISEKVRVSRFCQSESENQSIH